MAIFGLGIKYHDEGIETDMTEVFLSHGVAAVGWTANDNPSLHRLMRCIKTGDLIFLKTYIRTSSPPALRIRAVGVVIDDNAHDIPNIGTGVNVRWVWTGDERLPAPDPYNVRSVALYEELNPDVQQRILELLFSTLDGQRC
ncbi:MAG: hypothetical protein QXL01_04255 [Thermoplasmatales archaeon]